MSAWSQVKRPSSPHSKQMTSFTLASAVNFKSPLQDILHVITKLGTIMLPSVTSNITSKTVTWCSAKSFWWPANIDAYYKRGQHQQRWSNPGSNETKVSDLLAALHTALQILSTFPILITRTMIRSHTVVLILIFPSKMSKKNSIPKCHEWSLRYHLDIRFSMQTSKKTGYPHVMN